MSAIIQIREVTKTYAGGGGTRALARVSLDIYRGEVTLLMGPSGSGKTTLISILGGILRPTSGSVKIAGTEIARLGERHRPAVRRRHIGFIFQNFNLVPTLSAAENVEIALELKGVRGGKARRLARHLLEQVGLRAKCNSFPADLSGGEKQRVAIARALAGDPEVLLADEPTAALDSASGRVVMEKLRDLARRGRAVLIVTHDNRIVSYADRIIEIADGRINRDTRETTMHPIEDVESKAEFSGDSTSGRGYWRCFVAILLALLVGLGLYGLKIRKATAGAAPSPVAEATQSRPTAVFVSGAGRVEPASEEVKVGAPLPGRLTRVGVVEGQKLAAGEIIAVLDNSELAARVAQAEANVALHHAEMERLVNGSDTYDRQKAAASVTEARVLLEKARFEWQQRKDLLATGDIARVEVERARREVDVAQLAADRAVVNAASVNAVAREDDRARAGARLAAAEAQLQEARAMLAKTIIRAPFAGVVLKRYHRTGEYVGAGSDPIVSFGDTSRIVVRLDVDEADIARIHAGDPAYCTAQAYGGQRFPGRVVHIGGQLGRKNIETGDPTEKIDTRVLETLIELDGTPALPVGLRVDVFVEVAARR